MNTDFHRYFLHTDNADGVDFLIKDIHKKISVYPPYPRNPCAKEGHKCPKIFLIRIFVPAINDWAIHKKISANQRQKI